MFFLSLHTRSNLGSLGSGPMNWSDGGNVASEIFNEPILEWPR